MRLERKTGRTFINQKSSAGGDLKGLKGLKPATRTVVIGGTKYAPGTPTVKRGDTIVWINNDPFPHTVTAKGVFDSHDIAASRS